MTADAQSARDDLAFMRALVGGDDESKQMRGFGEAYLAAGLIYGGQMLLHAAQALGWLGYQPAVALAIGIGPTVLFAPVMTWIVIRNRANAVQGTVSRAIAGIFGAIGLANIVLIGVIGSVAWHQQSTQTWLIFPCVVFVLQGTAWLFAYMMRRRRWFAVVAAGWYACAVAMAFSIFALQYFILFAGIGMWLCMALPGWLMLRRAA